MYRVISTLGTRSHDPTSDDDAVGWPKRKTLNREPGPHSHSLHHTTSNERKLSSAQKRPCFAYPSSRARAPSPLLATSRPLLCACSRVLPALVLRGPPELLGGNIWHRFCFGDRRCADSMYRDAFTKREAAAEDLYIRQEERAKYVSNIDPLNQARAFAVTGQNILTIQTGFSQLRRSSSSKGNTLTTSTNTC